MAKDRFNELLALISNGKATATDKIEFATLLQTQSQQEAQKEREAKIDRIKEAIDKEGLTYAEVSKLLQGPPSIILEWVDSKGLNHIRYEGEKGKFPQWVQEMKETITQKEAEKLAKNDKGRAFVKKVYEPKD